MARIGLMGGTFNPPHIGHLICAQEAALQLELERVLFVPVNVPPHKALEVEPGVEHRIELCRRAIRGDDRFQVSLVDVERDGPSYTVDTLRHLHSAHPEDELTFIVGGDMAHSLPTWREPEEVLELALLAVAEREGVRRMDIAQRLAPLRGAGRRVRFLDMPRVDVSSSMLRRRAAAGLPLRYLVPDAVADYIAEHDLYRVGAPA